MARSRAETRTGGRPATTGTIAGDFALSVGISDLSAPEGWHWTKLTDVARLETGHTPSRKHPEYWEGEIPWIGIKDATGNHGRKIYDTIQHTSELGIANSSARILPENTICLSRTASVGHVVVMGRPMATSQDFVNWVCSENLDSQFLKYVLLGERNAFLRFASGTTHQTIYFPEVKAFHICLPTLPEQHAIAHILGTLDDKIELNRRINYTLETMTRALFKSWFVDFDPVRAKMEGQDLGLPQPLAALFPARLVDSELGKIPEGWKAGTLGEVAFLNSESWKPSRPPEAIRYVDLTSTKWGYIEHIEPYTWNDAPSRARRVLRKGDTIVSTVRPGNGSFALIDEEGLTGSTGFAVLRPNEATDRELVWCAATSSENIDRLSLLADGGAYPAVPPGDVFSTPVAVAQPEVREAFSRLSDSLFDRMEEGKRESRNLAALRDALLPKLISGDIRLRKDGKMAEAVA